MNSISHTNIHGLIYQYSWLVYQYSWSCIPIFMVVMSQLKPTSVRFTGLLISKASSLPENSSVFDREHLCECKIFGRL